MQTEISKLLQIEHDCKSCESDRSLFYIIVNQTREIIDYEQAVLLSYELSSKLKVIALSDMASIDSTSLYASFVEDLANHLIKNNPNVDSPFEIDIKTHLSISLSEDLKEYSPPNIMWVPLKISKNNVKIEYHLVLFRIDGWQNQDKEVLAYLASSYKYFLFAMRKCSFSSKLSSFNFKKSYWMVVFAIIVAFMFYPVQMNVVAPFEIEALKPYVVTSPIEGVVNEILIEPNQEIKANTLIVKFEDIDFKNNYEISRQKLEEAKAELYSTKQASFFEREKLSQIPTLQKNILLKQSELNFYKNQLSKTKIYAQKQGIAIIDNPLSFKGKPLNTGEKIMMIADKNEIQAKIMVPVSDAIFLQKDANVTLTFDNKVLEEWSGKVLNISYNPQLTPEKILSYKVIANIKNAEQSASTPQIGLRGTAKIYSKKVTLFYYLFRKPLTHLKQMGIW